MEYDRCGVPENWTPFPVGRRDETHFARLRDEAGYHVMGCGKLHLGEHDFGEGDGFIHDFDEGEDRSSFEWDRTGRNLLEEWDFSDGILSARKMQTTLVAEGDPPKPGDPYGAYLAENGLLETHIEDYRRRRDSEQDRQSGTPLDHTATFPTPLPDEAYFDNWITRKGLSLIEDAPRDEPWFLQVNFQNPHDPWDVTENMHGWYRDPDVEFPGPVRCDLDIEPETHQEIRRNYAAMVENVDRWVGRLLEVIEERGERENTVVVYASDHGEMLGDHGMWYKRSPYRQSASVPLLVSGPGIEPRGVVDTPATTLDLHATFRDYAGIDTGRNDSRSMRPYLAGGTDDHRDVVTSGIYHWRLAFDGRYKLIRGFDESVNYGLHRDDVDVYDETALARALDEHDPLLFDLEADPDEVENLADDRPDAFERLDDALAELRLGSRAGRRRDSTARSRRAVAGGDRQ